MEAEYPRHTYRLVGGRFVIGVVGDTHVPDRTDRLVPGLLERLEGVDLILHTGDISSAEVLDALGEVAPVLAVRGNNRGDRGLGLPFARVIEVDGMTMALTHGVTLGIQRVWDYGVGRLGRKDLCARYTARRVRGVFPEADVVIFGHAHWPVITHDGVGWLFNPGQGFGEEDASWGRVSITPEEVRFEVLPLGPWKRLGGEGGWRVSCKRR